jgi:hypothetical protein
VLTHFNLCVHSVPIHTHVHIYLHIMCMFDVGNGKITQSLIRIERKQCGRMLGKKILKHNENQLREITLHTYISMYSIVIIVGFNWVSVWVGWVFLYFVSIYCILKQECCSFCCHLYCASRHCLSWKFNGNGCEGNEFSVIVKLVHKGVMPHLS